MQRFVEECASRTSSRRGLFGEFILLPIEGLAYAYLPAHALAQACPFR
jgi:hypothetical protein